MRRDRSAARAYERLKRREEAARTERAQTWDRRAAGIVVAVTVAAVAILWFAIPLAPKAYWTPRVAVLLLVVAAAAARQLLGSSPPREGGEASGRWQTLTSWPLVAAAAVLPYLHSLSVGLLSDDFGMLWAARSAGGALNAVATYPLAGFFRPLTMLAWWGGDRLWSGAGMGYHAVNIIVHAANAVLVYALARRVTGRQYAAVAAGLLFAVHPLHVEPVVWLCCSSDLVCTFFSLLSLLALEGYLSARSAWSRWLAVGGAVLSFAAALAAKEAALALPGVAALRLALTGKENRWRRLAAPTAAYAAVLLVYLGWRVHQMGQFGGYRVLPGFWNTLFPSAVVWHIASFFFPLNKALFASLRDPVPYFAVLILMAAGLVWCLLRLTEVPARRLYLWLGFLFLMTVPVWTLATGTADLEHSRFAYLPTIGLAWLVGDVCAAGAASRRSKGVLAAALVLAAGLTAWYVTPWRWAHRTAEKVTTAGVALLADLEQPDRSVGLYVDGLPRTYQGAQVLRNCYTQALGLRLGRRAPVRVVGSAGDISQEALALSALLAGEHVVAWDARAGRFRVLRSGAASASALGVEAFP
jgi:hypothetical protein